jgi:hypothetical protein
MFTNVNIQAVTSTQHYHDHEDLTISSLLTPNNIITAIQTTAAFTPQGTMEEGLLAEDEVILPTPPPRLIATENYYARHHCHTTTNPTTNHATTAHSNLLSPPPTPATTHICHEYACHQLQYHCHGYHVPILKPFPLLECSPFHHKDRDSVLRSQRQDQEGRVVVAIVLEGEIAR